MVTTVSSRRAIAAALGLAGVAFSCTQQPIPALAAAGSGRAGLPPLPSWVPSALGPVPVHLVDSIPSPPGGVLVGGFYPGLRKIEIRRGLSPPAAWAVLEHERCHVQLWDGGVRGPTAWIDQVCDAIGIARVREMLVP